MKYSSLILEEVVIGPRNFTLFVENLTKRLNDNKAKLDSLYLKLKTFGVESTDEQEDREYYFNRILRSVDVLDIDYSDLERLQKSFLRAYKPFSETLPEKIKNLYDFVKSEKSSMFDRFKFVGYIKQSIEHFIDDLKPWEKTLNKFQNIIGYEEALNDYKEFFIFDPVAEFKEYARTYQELLALLETFYVPKFNRFLQLQGRYNDDEMRHETGDVEILYHASVNATQLAKEGFRKNINQSVEGLGGANTDKSDKPAVSFTADIYVAKEIARCFKEIIMIAKGQLDFYDIDTMAMQEGISDTLKKYYPFYADEKNVVNATPKIVFDYYRYYLSSSKLRYDPWFVDTNNIISVFKNKNVEDVGVLVCKVNMTDPNIKYLYSMEEYRVNPNNIVSIEKVLK